VYKILLNEIMDRMRRKQIAAVVFLLVFGFFFLAKPSHVDPANFTHASVLLQNSRLSYRAGLQSVAESGRVTVVIDSYGNPDLTTRNLFTNDTICFLNPTLLTCRGDRTYQVSSIASSTSFTTTAEIADEVVDTDVIIATQSGSMTIQFNTQTAVPINGDLLITIPAVNEEGKTNDGLPDTSSSVATNGFDLHGITTSDVSVTGCTDQNWSVTAVTPGTATTDHTIRIDRQNTVCDAGSTIKVVIDSNPGIVNPAALLNHTQGTADIYTLRIKSRDTSDEVLDDIYVRVAPIEGVVTLGASLGEGLAFTVSGVTNDEAAPCNVSRTAQSPDTTASAIPWGTIQTPNVFLDAAQKLTVSTNSTTGYSVSIEQNDQMGKDGKQCVGSTANYNSSCIQDTTCSATACSITTPQNWTDPTQFHGLGYSLQNVTGADTTFSFNDFSRLYSAKQLPDKEAGENDQLLMTNASPAGSKEAYVCYRLSIPAPQPAGYYYNTVRYTAIANF
jgi:hypothetical protein